MLIIMIFVYVEIQTMKIIILDEYMCQHRINKDFSTTDINKEIESQREYVPHSICSA